MAPKRGGSGGGGRGGGGRRGGRGGGPGRGSPTPNVSPLEFVLFAGPGFPLGGCPAEQRPRGGAVNPEFKFCLWDRSTLATFLEWFAAGLAADPGARILVWQGTRDDKKIIATMIEQELTHLAHTSVDLGGNWYMEIRGGASQPPPPPPRPAATEGEASAPAAAPAGPGAASSQRAERAHQVGHVAKEKVVEAAYVAKETAHVAKEKVVAAAAVASEKGQEAAAVAKEKMAAAAVVAAERGQEAAAATKEVVTQAAGAAKEAAKVAGQQLDEGLTVAGQQLNGAATLVGEKAKEIASETQAALKGERGATTQLLAITGAGVAAFAVLIGVAFGLNRTKARR